MTHVRFQNLDIEGVGIFYREAGPKDAPVVLLLPGQVPDRRARSPRIRAVGHASTRHIPLHFRQWCLRYGPFH